MNNVLNKLDKVFKKSDTVEKFEALDNFETYRRPHNVSISDFVIEFDKRYNKTKSLGTNISDDLLGYRMIKSANLCDQDEKMIKATCTLTYDDVKSKLKSVFSDAGNSLSVKNENIKKEEVLKYITHITDTITLSEGEVEEEGIEEEAEDEAELLVEEVLQLYQKLNQRKTLLISQVEFHCVLFVKVKCTGLVNAHIVTRNSHL